MKLLNSGILEIKYEINCSLKNNYEDWTYGEIANIHKNNVTIKKLRK